MSDVSGRYPGAMASGFGSTTGTQTGVVSAVFDDPADAQRALNWLRGNGVAEHAISILSRQGGDYRAPGEVSVEYDEDADEAAAAGTAALTGAGVGAGVGALFGLAAAAIPGAGPFLVAGTLAQLLGTYGGSAAAGAVVGGTSGALGAALSRWGLNEAESSDCAAHVERGGTWVGVDLSGAGIDRDTVVDALRRFNGRFRA